MAQIAQAVALHPSCVTPTSQWIVA